MNWLIWINSKTVFSQFVDHKACMTYVQLVHIEILDLFSFSSLHHLLKVHTHKKKKLIISQLFRLRWPIDLYFVLNCSKRLSHQHSCSQIVCSYEWLKVVNRIIHTGYPHCSCAWPLSAIQAFEYVKTTGCFPCVCMCVKG